MNLQVLERRCRRNGAYTTVITSDGSLTGGGGTLQVGVRDRSEITSEPIAAYWADRWGTADFEMMRVKPGYPDVQARCEALTLLICIKTWEPLLTSTQGPLTSVGGAMGVLQDAIRYRSREPIFNGMMGEIALLLAPSVADIRAAHIWSERNTICNALRRIRMESNVKLPALSHAQCVKRKPTPHNILDSVQHQ